MRGTLEQISNPLPDVLAAWKALLKKAGHTVYSVAAFDEGPDESKKSPYLEIMVTNLAASGQEHPLPDGTRVWASWGATLHTRAATMRGKNGDKHVQLVGGIYALAAECKRRKNGLLTPFHSIQFWKPAGLTSSTDGLLDYSEIQLDIAILVLDSAWGE